jgi:hypothetical protein
LLPPDPTYILRALFTPRPSSRGLAGSRGSGIGRGWNAGQTAFGSKTTRDQCGAILRARISCCLTASLGAKVNERAKVTAFARGLKAPQAPFSHEATAPIVAHGF